MKAFSIKKVCEKNKVANIVVVGPFVIMNRVLGISYRTSGSLSIMTSALINESVYKIEEGNKINLVPSISGLADETMYQEDFNRNVINGYFKVCIVAHENTHRYFQITIEGGAGIISTHDVVANDEEEAMEKIQKLDIEISKILNIKILI